VIPSQPATGSVLAGVGLALLFLAWVAWPSEAAPRAASMAVVTADTLPEPRALLAATRNTPASPRAVATETTRIAIRIQAPRGTPTHGVVRLLRRPEFAPDVRLEDELWAAFAAGPRGDLFELSAWVFDRLARVGYERVGERTWVGEDEVTFDREGQGAGGTGATAAVALSAQAVGFLWQPGPGMHVLPIIGAGEVVLPDAGPAWAWSEGAFPGPHDVGDGKPVPAAKTWVVQWLAAAHRTLRYYDPVEPGAGGKATPSWTPARRTRVVTAAVGQPAALVHAWPAAGRSLRLPVGPPEGGSVVVHEEGRSPGPGIGPPVSGDRAAQH